MKKIIYVLFMLLIYSCSNLILEEKNENILKLKKEKLEQKYFKEKINEDIVRVKITRLSKEVLNITSNLEFIINNENFKNVTIYIKNNKIVLNNKEYDSIYIKNNGLLNINNYNYSGDFLLKFKNNELLIINFVNIQEYIKGVLPYEMPLNFPLEALKAQVVIIRTYTYSKLDKNKDYDLDDTIKYQVYKGFPINNIEKINKVVNDTNLEVITYDNKIIEALFHSYSGGYTASAKEVYGNDIPYLISVEDNYSKYVDKKLITWQEYISNNELKDKLGFIPTKIEYTYSESNRIKEIIMSNESKSLKMTGRKFRKLFNLKSTSFTFEKEKNGLKIIGSGYGHGVGFSQWSSKTMAIEYNMDYKQIIKFFYNNVEIKNKEN